MFFFTVCKQIQPPLRPSRNGEKNERFILLIDTMSSCIYICTRENTQTLIEKEILKGNYIHEDNVNLQIAI